MTLIISWIHLKLLPAQVHSGYGSLEHVNPKIRYDQVPGGSDAEILD